MTDTSQPIIVDAATLEAAKLEQIVTLRAAAAELLQMVDTMRTSQLQGFSLWMGGLPHSVSQVEAQLNFAITTLTTSFGLPPASR